MRLQRPFTYLPAWLLLLPLLAGCGGGGGSSNGGGGDRPLPGPDPTTLSLSATTADGLAVSLAQDRATIPVNSGVVYTLSLTNNNSTAVTIQAPTQPGSNQPLIPVDLTIVDSVGKEVYPDGLSNAPTKHTGPAVSLTLQPGQFLSETVSLSSIFPQRDRYQATATFHTGVTTAVGPLVLTAR